MRTKVTISILVLLLSASSVLNTNACTGLRLITEDGGVVVGRTLEFGLDPHSEILVFPAGKEISSSL
ncbi:MAG: choloylglycine hydrolase, partial [Bacteroidales bacterium]|nr:choloylglycine hydrolase [Bacteroidales bacterium]